MSSEVSSRPESPKKGPESFEALRARAEQNAMKQPTQRQARPKSVDFSKPVGDGENGQFKRFGQVRATIDSPEIQQRDPPALSQSSTIPRREPKALPEPPKRSHSTGAQNSATDPNVKPEGRKTPPLHLRGKSDHTGELDEEEAKEKKEKKKNPNRLSAILSPRALFHVFFFPVT